MSRPVITRRGLVQPMAVAVPSDVDAVMATEGVSMTDTAFDASGFVADLRASGFAIDLWRSGAVDDGSEGPSYGVRRVDGGGLGDGYSALLDRWNGAMAAVPDHHDRVLDVLKAECAAIGAGERT